MTTSPFAAYKNAVLTFQIGGAGTVDPLTGNQTFARTAVVVEAILNPPGKGRDSRKIERPPGIDPQALYLEGYATEPMQLPSTIRGNQWAEAAEIAGRSGKFYLEISLSSPYGVDIETGTPLKGWFQIEV